MEITAAEALVRCLEEEKVEVIFGYPGGFMIPVYDALYHARIKHVLVRHEQGAVHAADGYARATGKVGVCMSTSGPGATNLVTGIANAYMDSVPLVIFTGQVPTNQVGTDAFQEVDITGITIPITKHNYLVKNAQELPRIIKSAFYIANTGRPGPVLIDLPMDVAQTRIKFEYPQQVNLKGYKPTYRGHPLKIVEAAQLIKQSRRPVIYAGGGIISSGAHEELVKLAETISAPVTNTLMGLSSFPGDHPLFLGMLGLHGTRYANIAVTECDLLIALGARFDIRAASKFDAFAPHAAVIHVDIDPAEIGKNVKVDVPIVGDVKLVLQELLPLLEKTDRSEWLARIKGLKERYPLRYQRGDGLKPQMVIESLYRYTRGEAVIVTDVGQHQMWVAQYYHFKRPRSLISSGGLGTMGFGLPAAVGAQLGVPDKQVILITGDGSFQMTIQELATLKEQELPVKIIMLNNFQLGMVRQIQHYYCEGRYMAVDFKFHPDFITLAKAYGIKGYTVRTEEEVEEIIPRALSEPGPVLVNCLVNPGENVLPMVPTGRRIDETF
ncbi:biosynthetic-type acetolactate synthase large subunit [Desulfofundulus thermocisternus]|uniref:biosynthetic-type acetolactate synthase large subunit n=1 Tax=Desulfofundulus thermocisternus TaxID=42471 RepID=UPI0019F26DD7|nr:biosynthetic-type acetolactate synthase large subunit [Desulfofundulus thermocisternus]MBE3586059.1 biosynthetic-type acetolactate synthase large subunit [Thermoanaerobacter sp.]MCS5695009.1 biosynthetic-type acetolactate synthase large subunit [Desulfofundulus thermocisternus]